MLSIPFVGELRSQVLEDAGYDLEKVKNAKPEELAKLDGFSVPIAEFIITNANLVEREGEVPREVIFKEFRCPECGAIVSEVEPYCHRCWREFYDPPDDYEELLEDLGMIIAGIINDPSDPALWRMGANILSKLDMPEKASDFKFRASALELDILEESKGEESASKGGILGGVLGFARRKKKAVKKYVSDGLVNGSGVSVEEINMRKRHHRVKVIMVVAIILIPVFMAGILTFGARPAISIDGNFSDWSGIPGLHGYVDFFHSVKIKSVAGYTYIYVAISKYFPVSSSFRMAILVDDDSNPDTGYPVNRLGVDHIIWIYGNSGNLGSRCEQYMDGNWTGAGTVDFALRDNAVELKTYKFSAEASFEIYYHDSMEDRYSSIYTMYGHVWALLYGGSVAMPGDCVENITFWNSGNGVYQLNSISLRNIGNATVRGRLVGPALDIKLTVGSQWAVLRLAEPLMISAPVTYRFIYLGGGAKYETLKILVNASGTLSVIDRSTGAYIEAVPAEKKIDGIFMDWQNAKTDARTGLPENIDLARYGSDTTSGVKIYLSVYGNIFGTGAPKLTLSGGNGTGGNESHTPKLPRDTVEIYVDSDRNADTGYRIGNIGADYLVRLVGNLERVVHIQTYVWHGRWVDEGISVNYAKDANSMEVGLNLQGRVFYRLVNYDGLWDRGVMGAHWVDRAVMVKPTKIGTFNTTALMQRFGNDVNITDGWDYNQTSPSIVSNGSALFVAFDAGYADLNGHVISVGFACSSDGGETWDAYYFTGVWGSAPVITRNGAGDVFIFFENHTTGADFEFLVHYHTNGTDSSGAPVWTLMTVTAYNYWSSIYDISAAGEGTYIYVSYEHEISSSQVNIEVMYSSNSGEWTSTWESSTVAGSGYNIYPSVTISTGLNPKVFVAYSVRKVNATSGYYYYELWYNYSSAGGTSWSSGTHLSASDGTAGLDDDLWPSWGASADYAFIVWAHKYYDSSGNEYNVDLWFANISVGYGSVLSVKKITDGTSGWEQAPDIFVYGTTIYVAYFNSTTGGDYIDLLKSSDGGNTWSAPVRVSDDGQVNGTVPAVGIYFDGEYIYIVWADDSPGSVNQEYADIFFDMEAIPELNYHVLVPLLLMVPALLLYRRRRR